MTLPLCLHCNVRKGCRPRGLCPKCFDDVEIRCLYQLRNGSRDVKPAKEPTMQELDAMIAERLPTMPGGKPEGHKAAQRRLQWRLPIFRNDRRRGRTRQNSERSE
jgi:hypothetical protein